MVDLRLIKAEDIPNLKYSKMDWDVCVRGVSNQVCGIPAWVVIWTMERAIFSEPILWKKN